jgi:hypothetical protein
VSTGGEDKERKLRFLDALEIASLDDPPPLSAAQLADDTATILARVRSTMAGREPAPVLPPLPRRRADRLPLVALALLTLGVALFPRQDVLQLLLFAVAPIALVLKWTFEAYAGPELERECAVLDQRARRFALLRRRLGDAAGAVAAARTDRGRAVVAGAEHVDEALSRIRAVGNTLDVLADLVERTSKASRAFATNWLAAPVASFSAHRNETAGIAPDRVRATVADALAQLRGLASMNIEIPMRGEATDTADPSSRTRTVAAEIEAVVHEVAQSQTTLDRELRRLERAFDTVHHSAATHVIKTHIPARMVRVAALIGMNLNVSTLSRARRTPARTVFLQEARMAPDTSLRHIHRAAVAMRTAA